MSKMNEYIALDEALELLNEGIISTLRNKFKHRKDKKSSKPEKSTGYIAYLLPANKIEYKNNTTEEKKYSSIYYTISEAINHAIIMSASTDIVSAKLYKMNIVVHKCNETKVSEGNNFKFKIEYIEVVFASTVEDAINEYNINIPSKEFVNKRNSIYKKAVDIARKVINNAKKLPEWNNCYYIEEDEEDSYDDYVSDFCLGIDSDISIIGFCLDDLKIKGNNGNINKYDYFQSDEFAKLHSMIYNEFKDQIHKSFKDANVEYIGDWDFGGIYIFIKQKN